ncbi:hypothetical protein QKR10_gp1 [Oberland virus]|uniref:Uncharacterized protein n=1 Tax=Oberland virus TaxID=2675849 RepID=A0A974MYZ9_9MONO|nr:hypothetical protein QKR10_gp1 [Oberland virus]QOI11493.1 hypothetical protein [Oberland virus]
MTEMGRSLLIYGLVDYCGQGGNGLDWLRLITDHAEVPPHPPERTGVILTTLLCACGVLVFHPLMTLFKLDLLNTAWGDMNQREVRASRDRCAFILAKLYSRLFISPHDRKPLSFQYCYNQAENTIIESVSYTVREKVSLRVMGGHNEHMYFR